MATWFSKHIIMNIYCFIFQNSWNKLSQPPRHPHRPAGSSAHHHHLALHRERDEADPQDPVRVCVRRLSLSRRITETEHVTVLFQLRGGGCRAERRGSNSFNSHWHGDVTALRNPPDQHRWSSVSQAQGKLSVECSVINIGIIIFSHWMGTI